MKNGFNIAVVGATGIVGSTLLDILAERKFPIEKLYLLASHRSAGEIIDFKDNPYVVQNIEHFDFSQTEISFFCVNNEIAAEYAPKAAELGNVVIDKSSHFRYDPEVPLVVPEVNESAIADFKNKQIIASPNCSTIPVVVALKPIYDKVGISRVNITTFQSVSGSGREGVTELAEETVKLLSGQPIKPKIYSQQIAFNVLPQIDSFQENGYTREEMKIVWETQKILNDATLAINPTAVRVPVFYGHSASVNIETKKKINESDVTKLLKKAPSIELSKQKHDFPTPVRDAAGKDAVYVGRVREDISLENGINFWVVTDNLRKGAALNAIQIAEILIKKYL